MTAPGQELVIRGAAAPTAAPPALEDAIQTIHALVTTHDASGLKDILGRLKVAELYSQHAQAFDQEQQFVKLRLLTEAALGALSYDDPAVVKGQNQGQKWRVLAAAYEREILLNTIQEESAKGTPLSTDGLVWVLRERGVTYTRRSALGLPGKGSVAWRRARQIARSKGLELSKLPLDPARLVAQRKAYDESARRMKLLHELARRQARIERSRLLKKATRDRGPGIAATYALLRRTLQALHDAQSEFSAGERKEHLDGVFWHLYRAEESLADALKEA